MAAELTLLRTRIHELMGERPDVRPDALLAEMEHTLTDGYAHALALEGLCRRMERDIGRLALEVEGDEHARDLRDLAEVLAQNEADLVGLRALLHRLRVRLEVVRDAAPRAVEPAA